MPFLPFSGNGPGFLTAGGSLQSITEGTAASSWENGIAVQVDSDARLF